MRPILEDASGRAVTGDPWQRFRDRVRRAAGGDEGEAPGRRALGLAAETVLLVPDVVHLVGCLVADPEVPARRKARLAAALAYRLTPFDLVPEALLGPVGLLDDLALLCWALDGILNEVPEAVVLRHWSGSPAALSVLREAVALGDEVLGAGLFERAARLARLGQRLRAAARG